MLKLTASPSRRQARYSWVFRMLEQQAEARDFDPAPLFPDAGPEELLRQVSAVREWLKGLPLGRRPLVQVRAPG